MVGGAGWVGCLVGGCVVGGGVWLRGGWGGVGGGVGVSKHHICYPFGEVSFVSKGLL